MTTTELEAYKAEIANEILNVKSVRVLAAIRSIIERSVAPQNSTPVATSKATSEETETLIIPKITSPCCYTIEEIDERITSALEAYQQGIYFISEKFKKGILRWTENARNDTETILNYVGLRYSENSSWNFTSLIDGALEKIIYNPKIGKKEPLFADMCDGNIRCLDINRYSKLTYVEMPECILVLAIYTTSPLDSYLKLRK